MAYSNQNKSGVNRQNKTKVPLTGYRKQDKKRRWTRPSRGERDTQDQSSSSNALQETQPRRSQDVYSDNSSFRDNWKWAHSSEWSYLMSHVRRQPRNVDESASQLFSGLPYARRCVTTAMLAHCRTMEEVDVVCGLEKHAPVGLHEVIKRVRRWSGLCRLNAIIHVMDETISIEQIVLHSEYESALCHFLYFPGDEDQPAHLAPTFVVPKQAEARPRVVEISDPQPAAETALVVYEARPAPGAAIVRHDRLMCDASTQVVDTLNPEEWRCASLGTGYTDDCIDLSRICWWTGNLDEELMRESLEPGETMFSMENIMFDHYETYHFGTFSVVVGEEGREPEDDETHSGFHWAPGRVVAAVHRSWRAQHPYVEPLVRQVGQITKWTYWGELPARARDGHELVHVSGWLAQFTPTAERDFGEALRGTLHNAGIFRPDVCCATQKSIQTFGTAMIFMAPKPSDLAQLLKIDRRTYTDGLQKVVVFKAGDRVSAFGRVYIVHRIEGHELGDGLLKLVMAQCELRKVVKDCFDRFCSFLPGLKRAEPTIIPPLQKDVDEAMVRRSKWTVAALTQTDAVRTALINRERLEAAKNGYERNPDFELMTIAQISKEYPKAIPCCGRFLWGYCYSCGCELPSKKKFPSRLCPGCLSSNSTLGKLVMEGDKVCSASVPVRYPGVVWTPSRHPGLKPNVATIASDSCVSVSGMSLEQALTKAPIERAGPALFGIGIDGAIPFVTSGGIRPLAEAICYRIFKDIPRTAEPLVYTKATLLLDHPELLGNLLWRRVSPYGVYQWVKSVAKSGRRKILLKAAHELRERGCLHPKKAGKFGVFVKTECLPYFKPVEDGLDWAMMVYVARLINGPFDEDHVITGPSLKPLIPVLKEVWHVENWIFYASVNPSKLDKRLDQIKEHASFLCSDFTAFDSTFTDYSWDMIESIYRRVLVDTHPDFWEILKRWRRPVGSAISRKESVSIKFQAGTCNASGRDDTALANAILNGIATALSLAAALAGVDLLALEYNHIYRASEMLSISIVGDDSLVACVTDLKPFQSAYESNIRRFGMIVKAEIYDTIHDVTFLGQAPYTNSRGEWAWGPTIGRRLYKAGWKAERGGNYPAWLHGVAGQNALYQNVPLLSDWAEVTLKLMKGQKRTEVVFDENRPWVGRDDTTFRYDQTTLEWVAFRYRKVGVSVPMILRDIGVLRSIERLPAVAHLESVQLMLSVDEL